MKLTLVTGNPNKAKEIQQIFPEVELNSQKFELPEIQSFDLAEIVKHKAQQAQQTLNTPVAVEDVSLEFSVLKKFPGPFVKFWEEAGGYERTVEISRALNDQTVVARCGVGYADGQQTLYAEGVVNGTWVARRGGEGFGFDFYFLPHGSTQTFSELGLERKNQISHRALGWKAMCQLLLEKGLI